MTSGKQWLSYFFLPNFWGEEMILRKLMYNRLKKYVMKSDIDSEVKTKIVEILDYINKIYELLGFGEDIHSKNYLKILLDLDSVPKAIVLLGSHHFRNCGYIRCEYCPLRYVENNDIYCIPNMVSEYLYDILLSESEKKIADSYSCDIFIAPRFRKPFRYKESYTVDDINHILKTLEERYAELIMS